MNAKSKRSPSTAQQHVFARLYNDYVSKYVGQLILSAVFMAIAAASTAGQAWVIKPAVDKVLQAGNYDTIWLICGAIVLISAVKAGSTYVYAFILEKTGFRMVIKMQEKLFEHYLRSDIAFYAHNTSGEFISRILSDLTIIRFSLTSAIISLTKDSLTIFFLMGVMIYENGMLSLLNVVVIPLAAYPIIRLGKLMRKIGKLRQHKTAEFLANMDDVFSGVRVVKAYGREEDEVLRVRSKLAELMQVYIRAARVQLGASPIMELLISFVVAGVVYYGAIQVQQGAISTGGFISFIAAMLMAYKPLKSLAKLNAQIQDAFASADRFYEAIDVKAQVVDKRGAKALKVKKAKLALKDVTFHYGEGITALDNVSLEVPAGKRVALVGPSGAGKSTIMQLVMRFYDPVDGKISVNRTDIKDVTLDSLRSHMAIVSQEAMLFNTTIRENIAYSRPDATQEQIEAAAKAAVAHDFILEQSDGYDTMVGQGGVRLSGGQRQRIAIARAILRDAPILLLDEATSALDSESEAQVQEALDHLMEGRTTLVIAHRLSTIIKSDCIYVIDQGKVLEQGTHEALVKNKKGLYKRLYDQQFQG